MSRAEIETVVSEYLKALQRHDIEAAMAFVADDAVLHVNGRNVLSGTFQGNQHLRETYQWVFREFDAGTDVVSVHDLLVSDDHAVALVEERAHRDVGSLDYRRIMIFHVFDAKISELWSIAEDPHQLDAFWE